jgi:hypothetical protein
MIRTINGAIEGLRKEDPGGLRCPPLFGHEKRVPGNPETPLILLIYPETS